MKINVLMASGVSEPWEADEDLNLRIILNDGYLTVLESTEDEFTPENPYDYDGLPPTGYTIVEEELEDGTEFRQVYRMLAVYAPGMWIRTEFVHGDDD